MLLGIEYDLIIKYNWKQLRKIQTESVDMAISAKEA